MPPPTFSDVISSAIERSLIAADSATGAEIWRVTLDPTLPAGPVEYDTASARGIGAVMFGDRVTVTTAAEHGLANGQAIYLAGDFAFRSHQLLAFQ